MNEWNQSVPVALVAIRTGREFGGNENDGGPGHAEGSDAFQSARQEFASHFVFALAVSDNVQVQP